MKCFHVLPIILLSIAFCSVSQAQDGRKVTTQLDVAYLNDGNPQHRLDIYYPSQAKKSLSVLFHIHGGGWRIGDRKHMQATGMFYASQGFLFITPSYRLTPEVMHPSHVEDCAAALAWVFNHVEELGGDRSRIFVSGHSAGAHLAALLGTNQKYLQKYDLRPADLAGVISVDTASFNLVSGDHERLVRRLVKKAFGKDQSTLQDASPLFQITNGVACPRFLVLNTTNRAGGVREGREFTDKLRQAGCEAQFVPVDNHSHKEMAQGMYNLSDPVAKAILPFISGD